MNQFVDTGYWSLASGHWFLVAGFWPLDAGLWYLVTGNWSQVGAEAAVILSPWNISLGMEARPTTGNQLPSVK